MERMKSNKMAVKLVNSCCVELNSSLAPSVLCVLAKPKDSNKEWHNPGSLGDREAE